MGLQTAWTGSIEIGEAGGAADLDTIQSGRRETATIEGDIDVVPGIYMAQGAADDGAILPASAASVILGPVVFSYDRERVIRTNVANSYGEGDKLAIGRDKVYWVKTEEAVSKGDQVFVRHTAATFATIGYARTDLDTDSAVAIKATFAETTTAAGFAKVVHNMAQV
jgi:hypothetical protein